MPSNQIGTATNLTGPNVSTSNQVGTQQYFNNLLSRDFSIGPANDVIVAYFEKYTGGATTGKQMAATVLYTAQSQNIDPMMILAEFQKLEKGQIDSYLAALLNFNRVPTSTIGIKRTQQTSPIIKRTILP